MPQMKAKRFRAIVEVWRFTPPNIDQGGLELEWSGPTTVHRSRVIAPRWSGCARLPLKPVEFLWITYRGRRYPVELDHSSEPSIYKVALASTDNPPTADDLAACHERRVERLARKLLRRGLVKARARNDRRDS